MVPQIILAALHFTSLLLAAHAHGRPKEGNYSFWVILIATIIVNTLLYLGGWFSLL